MGDNERPGWPTSTGQRRRALRPAWRLWSAGLVVALGLAAVPPAHPAPSEAAAPGTWHGLGEAQARSEHTATLLARACPAAGRLCGVLVAGGRRDGAALASAEVFEPTRLQWEPTAPLATARSGHTATRLGDGLVLVTGGKDSLGSPLASVEIFEPDSARRLPDGSIVAGIWVAAPPMGSARAGQTATLLGDGRVLVAGGTDGSGAAIATAEVFDPIAGAWTAVAPMAKGRAGHAAARPAGPACTGPSAPAPCRTVMVTGGTAAAGEQLAS